MILLLLAYGLGNTLYGIERAPYYLKGSYFKTYQFANELEDFVDLFSTTKLDFIELDEAKKRIKIEEHMVHERLFEYTSRANEEVERISAEYQDKITEATSINDQEYASTLVRERDAKKTEIREQYSKSREEIIAILKEEEGQRLEKEYEENIDVAISRFTYKQQYIKYYIKDRMGTVYSNVEEDPNGEKLKKESVYFQKFPYHTKKDDHLTSVNRFFITRDLTGYIAIAGKSETHSLILENMLDYQAETNKYLIQFSIYLVVLLIGFFLALKYRRMILEVIDPLRSEYDKLPIDVRLLGIGIAALFMSAFSPNYYRGNELFDWFFYAVAMGALAIQVYFFWRTLTALKSLEEIKLQFSRSILWKIKKEMMHLFIFKSPFMMVLGILFIVFCLGFGVVVVAIEERLFPLYVLGVLIVGGILLLYILRKVAYYNQILQASNRIVLGDIHEELKVRGSGALAKLAENINRMRMGVQTSQKVQVKSERLKTELISNVSHDLRTPLTSILNYTDFLKNKELTEAEREQYVDIIDKKSKRLKVLIDDLFEVSKMASGDLELHLEPSDIVQLLKQALGEYDEKIKESSLTFNVTSSQAQLYAIVDGHKMWRVFENIISNILKYSLENTRVYISTVEKGSDIIITFKNISKYDLKDNIDELFERFKRGDKSRHTEGSGLGLAIAKSIVDHHGGSLEVEVDGDLFKTIVTLRKEGV